MALSNKFNSHSLKIIKFKRKHIVLRKEKFVRGQRSLQIHGKFTIKCTKGRQKQAMIYVTAEIIIKFDTDYLLCYPGGNHPVSRHCHYTAFNLILVVYELYILSH